jgi:hypothetical protein
MVNIGEVGTIYGNMADELTYVLLNQTTVFTIKTIDVNYNSVGMMTVSCIAVDASGNCMTKEKKFRFKKNNSGTLTIANVTASFDPANDAAMNGCDFDVQAVNNSIAIRVLGATGTAKQILWQISINPVNILSFNQY